MRQAGEAITGVGNIRRPQAKHDPRPGPQTARDKREEISDVKIAMHHIWPRCGDQSAQPDKGAGCFPATCLAQIMQNNIAAGQFGFKRSARIQGGDRHRVAARRQGARQDNQLALGAANGQGANDKKDPHAVQLRLGAQAAGRAMHPIRFQPRQSPGRSDAPTDDSAG
jgi:hypothetical protein